MTHDELLAKISRIVSLAEEAREIEATPAWVETTAMLSALRAVVELHKPFMYDGRFGTFERCSGCSSEEEWLGEIYPCPTSQTIQEQLK